MPIKDQPVGPLFTRLGIIRLGDPKKPRSPGKATPYFQLRDAPELIKLLSVDKPTELTQLNTMWPFDDVDRNLDDWYRLYGAGSIKCKGDGEVMETCVHGSSFVVSSGTCVKTFAENGAEFEPGDIVPCNGPGEGAHYPKCAECKIISYPKVMIIEAMQAGLFGYYQIGSGSTSKHGRANIRGALEAVRELVRFLTGRPHLANIPMILSLKVEPISTPMVDKESGEEYRARLPKPILHLAPHPDWIKAQTTAMLETAYQPLTQLTIPQSRFLQAPPDEITDYLISNATSRAGQDEIDDEIINESDIIIDGATGKLLDPPSAADPKAPARNNLNSLLNDVNYILQLKALNTYANIDQLKDALIALSYTGYNAANHDEMIQRLVTNRLPPSAPEPQAGTEESDQDTALNTKARLQAATLNNQWSGKPTKGQLGLIVGQLKLILGSDDDAKLFLAWLFDYPTKDFSRSMLKGPEVVAVLNEIAPEKLDGKKYTPTNAEAVEAFKLMLHQARTDSGQMEMELPETEEPEPAEEPINDNFPVDNMNTLGELAAALYKNLDLNKTQVCKLMDISDYIEISGTTMPEKYNAVAMAHAKEKDNN